MGWRNNLENMWEQVKRAKLCSSVRVGGRNPKSVWWDDEVKAAFKRKEDAWMEVLGAKDVDERGRCLKVGVV